MFEYSLVQESISAREKKTRKKQDYLTPKRRYGVDKLSTAATMHGVTIRSIR